MKKLFVLGTALTSVAFGNESQDSSGKLVEGKYYPHPELIHIDSSGIYVNVGERQHKVDGLFSDDLGVYVVKAPVNEWRCSKQHPNPPWAEYCLSCGLGRGK